MKLCLQIVRCFNMSEGNYGWCGTCDKGAGGPGQPGYCGADATGGKEEAVLVQAGGSFLHSPSRA